jgi:hypothetical protein
MYKKIVLISSMLLLTVLQKSATSIPSKWEMVDVSMSQLLNSGWQISGHSATRTASPGGPGITSFDNIIYTFVLSKGGKYIVCSTENPSAPTSQIGCRKLN